MAEININQQRAMPYLKAKKESNLFILLTSNFSSSASSPQFSSTNEELKAENSHLSQSLQRRHLHLSAIHYPTVVNQGSPRPKPPALFKGRQTPQTLISAFPPWTRPTPLRALRLRWTEALNSRSTTFTVTEATQKNPQCEHALQTEQEETQLAKTGLWKR